MKKEIVETVSWREQKSQQYKEQVNTWKHQHGVVKALFIDDDKGESGRVLYFKRPSRLELSASESLSLDANTKEVDLYKKSERLMVDCLLGGDLTIEQIVGDIELFLAIGDFMLYHLVQQKKTSWENC